MRKLAVIALLTAASCPQLEAQVRGFRAAAVSSPRHASMIGFSHTGRTFRHGFFPGPFFLGEPFWSDYPSDVALQIPPVIVVQMAPTVSEAKEDTRPAAAPLLIELQGDHYVRYGGESMEAGPSQRIVGSDHASSDHAQNVSVGRALTFPAPREKTAELAPAILIFHDGRQEEISSYAIVGGAIYVNSNYWTSGAWQKKIQLADLDLPSTFKLNQDRGVRFLIPAGPNEVVTRP